MSSLSQARKCPVDLDALNLRIGREGAVALLTIAEATALIASRTIDSRDDERSARNRVRMQIGRAIKLGLRDPIPPEDGSCLVPRADGRIAIDELIRWATVLHGDKFADMPRKPRVLRVRVCDGMGLGAKGNAVRLPGLPELKDAEIKRLHAEVCRLMEESAEKEVRRKAELASRFRRK